jgi:hypothetical protein
MYGTTPQRIRDFDRFYIVKVRTGSRKDTCRLTYAGKC